MLDAVPARVIPEAPPPPLTPQTKALGHEREYVVTFGPRRYRIRGLEKNLSYESEPAGLDTHGRWWRRE
jgi:hypothetical protein